jgi:phosphoglucomutase/phosphomannomutase
MPGSEGMARMMEVMAAFRAAPPDEVGDMAVRQIRDYEQQTVTPRGGLGEPLAGPHGDLVILDLANEGNYVACRPSGTEPKIKFYMFTFEPPEHLANLDTTKVALEERLDRMEADLRKFAGV